MSSLLHDLVSFVSIGAFVTTLAERLACGAAFFVDYGFPEAEYYHPQRSGGTLMCHRAHRADPDPLAAQCTGTLPLARPVRKRSSSGSAAMRTIPLSR